MRESKALTRLSPQFTQAASATLGKTRLERAGPESILCTCQSPQVKDELCLQLYKLLVTTEGADEQSPKHASIPSAFDFIILFLAFSPSYTKMDELLRPRPQAARVREQRQKRR